MYRCAEVKSESFLEKEKFPFKKCSFVFLVLIKVLLWFSIKDTLKERSSTLRWFYLIDKIANTYTKYIYFVLVSWLYHSKNIWIRMPLTCYPYISLFDKVCLAFLWHVRDDECIFCMHCIQCWVICRQKGVKAYFVSSC